MYNLIIDTCVWLNLWKKEYEQPLQKLSELIHQGKIRLILPEIVIEEWDRHKDDNLRKTESSIKSELKSAQRASLYLKQLDDTDAIEFERILSRLLSDEVEKLVIQKISFIEFLFNHNSTIKLPVTDKAKLQGANFALAKKAPFKGKNSMADAVILFDAINYVTQKRLMNSIFVSENKADFSGKNHNDIHDDLKDLLEQSQMKYFINIGDALNEVEANTISVETINQIEEDLELEVVEKGIETIRQRRGLSPIEQLLIPNLKSYLEEVSNNFRMPTDKEMKEFIQQHIFPDLANNVRIGIQEIVTFLQQPLTSDMVMDKLMQQEMIKSAQQAFISDMSKSEWQTALNDLKIADALGKPRKNQDLE